MKYDYTSVKNIYIICGKTDMRKGIDGLATLIQDSFELDPYGDSIFLFSGWSKDRYKCLYFDGDGFAMLYKRLDNGKLQWPKDENESTQSFPKRAQMAPRGIIYPAAKGDSAVIKRCILNSLSPFNFSLFHRSNSL